MTTTTHQGAVGAETRTVPCGGCGATEDKQRCAGCFHDFGTEASAWVRKHPAYATPAPRTDGGMSEGEDHAWTFERTRTYLLAELERLRADLHTIGEDLTGEQGKATSWLDVATGRVANVSSVLASATPAQPAGAVPDGLRELLDAVRPFYACVFNDNGDVSISTGNLAVHHWLALDRAFHAVNATHPAGQSAGSGAETDALVDRFSAALKVKLRAAEAKYGWKNGWLKSDWQVECQNGLLRHVGKGDPLDVAAYAAFCWHHGWPSASRRSTDLVTGAVIPTAGAIAAYETRYPDGSLSETSDNTIEAWNRVAAAVCLAEKPAPDSTRTGDEGTDWVLVPAKPTEEMIAAGWIDKEDVDPDDIYRAMIAARPAAPEAQGAWKHSHEEPEIGRRHVRLYEDGSGAVLLVRYDTGLLDAEGCDFEPHSNYPLGLWAYTPNGFRLWAEDHGDNRLTVPAPPASSGQEG